jgi:hypothetical protein
MTKPFTIYIMQSAHTDIGYTHPQEQIAAMYLEHYDRVLELCAKTAKAPVERRFKWTCETFWQVEQYLTHRPERLDDFLHFCRTGQIEISASYLHFTDAISPDAYARSFDAAVAFCRRYDVPLRTAMHADINGWSWALPDILAARDIPYFCSMVHIDSGTDPLGVLGSVHQQWVLEWGDFITADAPIRIPHLHRWTGAGGETILHWLNEHYLLGNVLGLSSPHGFHADKTRFFTETDRLTVDDIYATTQRNVPAYVEKLRASGYRHDSLLLSTGGFYVDNAPPDDRWLGIIERWNAEHSDIVLRSCTLAEWCDHIAAIEPDPPVYAAAWPDHWAHGLGSMSAEIALARRSQRRMPAIQRLVTDSADATAARELERAYSFERFALEHTFNAWSTTARPAASVVPFQHAYKQLHFYRTDLALDDAAGHALRRIYTPKTSPQLVVDLVAGQHIVHFSAADVPLDPETQVLVDAAGLSHPFQRDHSGLPAFVFAADAAAAGRAVYTLQPASGNPTRLDTAPLPHLETPAWRLSLDPVTGGLVSLHAQATGREWVAPHTYGFGQLVHERVTHPYGRQAVSNGAMLRAWGIDGPGMADWPDQPPTEQTTAHQVGTVHTLRGPVFDALVWQGASAALGTYTSQWRVYHASQVIELHIEWHKRWCDDAEAVYVAFPFTQHGEILQFETSGGLFQPGSHAAGGQIPGTCNSYYTVHSGAAMTSDVGAGLVWLPLDAPLVMPNELRFDRWDIAPWRWNGVLASMPVNHYWHTNFPTSQRGDLTLRYRLAAVPPGSHVPTAFGQVTAIEALGWR